MTPAEKSFLIDSLRSSCKPTKIYKTLDIKKSTYYYKKISSEFSVHKKQDSLILPLIRKIHSEARKTYGVKRITLSLKDYSLPFAVGEKRVRRIMHINGIICETVRRFRPHSKDKVDESGENLLNRNFNVKTLDTVWVTDITYIYIPGYGFAYLTTVIDLASRRPIGWYLSKNLKTESVIKALKIALVRRRYPKGVMIHSDRGCQFTSKEFRKFLSDNELIQSLSHKGCPYDNAVIESFHSALKKELVYRTYFLSYEHARRCLFDYIENFYSRVRLHSALGYITPCEMERRLAAQTYAAA